MLIPPTNWMTAVTVLIGLRHWAKDSGTSLQETLGAPPPATTPMDKIMAAVEAHLRHELQLSDYTTASIRNSGQIPERLRTRHKKEDSAYGRDLAAFIRRRDCRRRDPRRSRSPLRSHAGDGRVELGRRMV